MRISAAAISIALLVTTACAGGGGSSSTGTNTGTNPTGLTLTAQAGDAQITFSFNAVTGATAYTLYYGTSTGVTTATGTAVPMVASPFALPGLSNGTRYYAVATYTNAQGESAPTTQVSAVPQAAATGSPYDPTWANIAPTSTMQHPYNSGQTAAQNGTALKTAMLALTAGQKLEIAAGTYQYSSNFTLNIQGTAAAPIWICPAPGATVVIHMNTTGQNILNIGSGSQTRYLCIRGLEFTGGSHGLRFYDCTQVWLDQCEIHGTGDAGISTNTVDTSYLYITRNEIHDTDGTGEGMYLGANNGAVKMSNSIIALNHVYDTNAASVSQGDGIELKQGSFGNLIAENHVHDTKYPCILVYGTAGAAQNIVERNVCYRSGDNAMQIQGECIVRNNLVISAAGSAFASQVHQGNPTNLQVVHNTFVNSATAARLSSWNGASNMVFANNACYSNGTALNVIGGNTGITFAGNVCFGSVTGTTTGFVAGNGLSDFTSMSFDASNRNAIPTSGSALLGAASTTHATSKDIEGTNRVAPHDTGCYEG